MDISATRQSANNYPFRPELADKGKPAVRRFPRRRRETSQKRFAADLRRLVHTQVVIGQELDAPQAR